MLRVIDTDTCGLQGGIVEIASVELVDGKISNPKQIAEAEIFQLPLPLAEPY
ncbi:hypothetical protein Q6314_27395, partial [Klebsiella pneumoniae]|nr:hypothetical protein [Klebsiella pneumoniae]